MIVNTQKLFRQWDPLKLIELGESDSEYNGLALDIFLWYKRNQEASEEDVAHQAYVLIIQWSGDESEEILREAQEKGKDLTLALTADLQSEIS